MYARNTTITGLVGSERGGDESNMEGGRSFIEGRMAASVNSIVTTPQ